MVYRGKNERWFTRVFGAVNFTVVYHSVYYDKVHYSLRSIHHDKLNIYNQVKSLWHTTVKVSAPTHPGNMGVTPGGLRGLQPPEFDVGSC
jgi:hypothetical protein